MIQSPLNYTGGKYRLLPQILPLFPHNIHTFWDIFCGGCNVGINVTAKHIVFNDISTHIINLFRMFASVSCDTFVASVTGIIDTYKLSNTALNGYEFYNCDSSRGLSAYNKKFFLELRSEFNAKACLDTTYYALLYTLIVFSFNNQIRLNSKDKFNLPVGKRDFNVKMQRKLQTFMARLQDIDASFSSLDFREIDISKFKKNDFIYADPPYLITCASYNESGGWSEDLEKDLFSFLDRVHKKNIRFALSNVLRSKGKENTLLLQWLSQNNHYKVIHLLHSYANSNYQTKDKTTHSEEVLIVNY